MRLGWVCKMLPCMHGWSMTSISKFFTCRAAILESATHGALRSSRNDDIAVLTEEPVVICRAPMLESATHGALRSSLDDDIAVVTEDGEVGSSPKSPKRRTGSRSPISPFQGTSPATRSPKSPSSPNGLSPHSSDSDGGLHCLIPMPMIFSWLYGNQAVLMTSQLNALPRSFERRCSYR